MPQTKASTSDGTRLQQRFYSNSLPSVYQVTTVVKVCSYV